MNYAQLIEKLQVLPAEKQAEVFDFVEYLAERFAKHTPPNFKDWSEQEFAELAMTQCFIPKPILRIVGNTINRPDKSL